MHKNNQFIENFIDFIVSNQVEIKNIEEFFVLLFNQLIREKNFEKFDYFVNKYGNKFDEFILVKSILITKEANHELEKTILKSTN